MRATMPWISASTSVMLSKPSSICWRIISSSSALSSRAGIRLACSCSTLRPERQRVQCGQDRHRRQSGAPRALQPDHQAADRRERVTVERADVNRPAGPATGTIDIQPRRSGGDGAADRWRPQRRPLCVPALDHRQRCLLVSAFGRRDSLLNRPLPHEISDARVFAVGVVFGHAASIGRELCTFNGARRGFMIPVLARRRGMATGCCDGLPDS